MSAQAAAAAWRRVLALPWAYVPLGMALAVTVVDLATRILPGPLGGVLILIAVLSFWVLLFALASRLLLQAACGGRSGQDLDPLDVPPGVGVRHVLLWLLASVLLALIHAAGGLPGALVASLALALLLPGATLALSSGETFSDALYPPEWRRWWARLGRRDYLSLSLWLVLYALCYLLLAAVLVHAAPWFRNAVQMTWWSAAVLAWFAYAGLLLNQHRPRAARPERPVLPSAADPLALFEHVQGHGADAELHRKLARALEAGGHTAQALVHAQVHIPALLDSFERPLEALEQADRLLALRPNFSLDDPRVMRQLIDTARKMAPPELVVRLCQNYLQRYTASLFTDEVRLAGCEALAQAGALDSAVGRDWLSALAQADLEPAQSARLSTLRQPPGQPIS
ncbi:MAG: hypothetical protein ACXIUM_06860 [Wenzhouxiangella sp.]